MYVKTESKLWKDCIEQLKKKTKKMKSRKERKDERKREKQVKLIQNSVRTVLDIMDCQDYAISLEIPSDQSKNFLALVRGKNGVKKKEITRVDEALFVKMCEECGLSIREDMEVSQTEISKTYVICI